MYQGSCNHLETIILSLIYWCHFGVVLLIWKLFKGIDIIIWIVYSSSWTTDFWAYKTFKVSINLSYPRTFYKNCFWMISELSSRLKKNNTKVNTNVLRTHSSLKIIYFRVWYILWESNWIIDIQPRVVNELWTSLTSSGGITSKVIYFIKIYQISPRRLSETVITFLSYTRFKRKTSL